MSKLTRLGALMLLGLGLNAGSAQAEVVISQVYGGGGNSGATLTHDFIELFNRGSEPVSLDGWSVQYASSAGSTWQVTAISGTLPAGGYYLVQQAQGAGGSQALPTPDAVGTIPMAAASGKVALVASGSALAGSCPTSDANVRDFVGFGAANCFLGTGATGTLSNTTAAIRREAGCQNTPSNTLDFEVAAAAPRNSQAPIAVCGGSPPPDPDPDPDPNPDPDPSSTDLVISQVYGGGGNSGATLRQDFIELFNRGSQAVSLEGWSVQYASSTGGTWQVTALAGSIAPGGYHLVQQAAGAGGSEDLPTPDTLGTIAMAAGAGKIALVASTTSLAGTCPLTAESLRDFVGYGTAANCALVAPTGTISATNAAIRRGNGCTDTRNNGEDFLVGTPNPRNSASPTRDCSAPPPPPPTGEELSIPQIQGAGVGSPIATGTLVTTEGVVTAQRVNGYFIQSAIGEDDGNPATPEGLFVFTGNSGVPSGAAIGNRVRVTGRVSEFSRTPHGYPLTQLTSSTLQVLSSGNALPPIVVLGADDLSPDSPTDRLGRYQGMRVALPAARVVGPTNTFGDFYLTLADTPRPFREPGIGALDAVPLPPGNAIPRFDLNPERLRVESTGLVGGTHLFLDAGTTVENLQGVMYYDRGDFTLLMGDNASVVATGGATPRGAEATPGAIRVASYNIENFGGGNVTPARLDKLSRVFCQFLGNPDIVGLVEIGDLPSLDRLAQAINDDEYGHCPDSPAYQGYLLSNSGSQRLGYLVRTAAVANGRPRVEVVEVAEEFATELLVAPDGSTNSGPLFDRPPLRLQAVVNGVDSVGGDSYPLTVVLNHNLSLLSVNDLSTRTDAWQTAGNRSRGKRLAQAVRVGELVEARQAANPDERIVLIGDFNAFEFSDGYVDVMGIIGGNAAPAEEVLLWADSPVQRLLLNLALTVPQADRYSYVFEGNIQSLDHVLVNQAVLDSGDVRLDYVRVNSDFAYDNAGDPTVPVRTSDHDPLVASILPTPAPVETDLALRLTGPRGAVPSGRLARFEARVSNLGQTEATGAEARFLVQSAASRVASIDAPGWSCDWETVADGELVVCLSGTSLASGDTVSIAIDVLAQRTLVHDGILVEGEVGADGIDTDPSNNTGSASTKVTGKPLQTPPGR